MRLLRVQVPEFRALKDVDISFEPEFSPQVFPLGSLNGGGKSTLLQLVFVLFNFQNSSCDIPFIKNLLENFEIHNNNNKRTIAIFDFLYENQKIQIEFFCANNSYLKEFPISEDHVKSAYPSFVGINEVSFKLLNNENNKYNQIEHELTEYLDEKNICYLEPISNNIGFFCKTERNIIGKDTLATFFAICKKVYLICPSNQPYLFLSREERRALFTIKNKPIYDNAIKVLQEGLPSFFTFDFVDVLVEVFRRARANDFKERNKDNPFSHTEKLEADINNLFIDGKKIASLIIEQQRHTQDEIQGVFFKLPSGEEVYPEDLSHGELKRLAIFVLIKYHDIQDSIVLMDEIENGFHLDWQYTIVRDLVEWGKTNQYILATHSYELCTAVTPAHVKEIESKHTAQ